DIFDVVRLDEHHTGFFVADACGHGVAAAMLTMLVNRLLPMKEISGHSYRIVPPGEALSRFNAEFVRRRGELSTLITAVYGVIDSRTGNVTLAGAGHPPVVVSGPRGQEAIENNGPPAGVYDEYDYPQLHVTLAPDQTMLLYTDGFEVCFGHEPSTDGRKRFAIDRYLGGFRTLAEQRLTGTMSDAVQGLSALLDRQDGSLHQIDDITLLAVALDRSMAGQMPSEIQRAAA
ncbi:MAG: PP2C family protein-serine/threonine phosphatase, partial [Phycisphaerales bacterium]